MIWAILDWYEWLPRMARVFGGLLRGDLSLREIADRERGRDFDTTSKDNDKNAGASHRGPWSSDR